MRTLLVHNPSAGSGEPTAEALLAAVGQAGFTATYCSTDDKDFDKAFADPTDFVIVAGGDGTVAKAAKRLSDRKTPLGILPLGTANNIARCLEIAGDHARIVESLRDAPLKRLDLGSAVGPWGTCTFVESVGWGALAKVVDRGVPEDSNENKIALGRELFARILAEAQPSRVRLEADGDRIEGEFVFVEILNIGLTGPRVLISPSAKPGDRLLDIVYLSAARKQQMIDWLRSEPDDTPIPLYEIKARKATLIWREGPLRIDDEVFDAPEIESQIHIEIEQEGLCVCVPSLED